MGSITTSVQDLIVASAEVGALKERKRMVAFLSKKILDHYGCRGLIDTCPSCIGYRQAIDFANSGEGDE